MSHKSAKIEAMLAEMAAVPGFDRHYVGFFHCFNAQLYYEAHDVLEEVWLPIRGQAQAKFYQGLIQMAGGFVHLQKERLGPASRSSRSRSRISNFTPDRHAGIDLTAIRDVCRRYREAVLTSHSNPWSKDDAPQLALPSAGI